MSTKVLTQIQSDKIGKALTALAVTLNQMGFPWPDDAQADITAAYAALGEDMPFDFVTRPIGDPNLEGSLPDAQPGEIVGSLQ